MPWLPLPSQLFPSSLSLSPSMDAAGTSQARARADPARAAAQRGWCSGTAGATRRRLSLALLVSRGDAPAVAAAAALSVSPDSDVAVGVGAPNVHLDLRSVVVAVQLHKGVGFLF
ncbi:hypothetical protein BDA96_03G438200 [Sorghum bicolor]|uniref:Uncharacterized protein n=2 Tax=Sorghum bicolor TaxID=4558 RepID=A0A921RI89_SORBI|nr:hypothetical protein BDA96_03G438200 [Sorghum bicolor]OQU88126.1 hypothetical protein SORBI_3003G406300 [Sorghum bicolor]